MTSTLHDETTDPAAAPAETSPHRQVGVEIEVFLEGEQPYTVRVTNRERIAYEKTAARHREWPPMESGQHFAMTFVTWAAAKRANRTPLTFEQWQESLEDYEPVRDVTADPTR